MTKKKLATMMHDGDAWHACFQVFIAMLQAIGCILLPETAVKCPRNAQN